MAPTSNETQRQKTKQKSHMPENSFFYERVIPITLVGAAVVLAGLILFAAGVLLGFVNF